MQLAALPAATLECLADVVRPAELPLQDDCRPGHSASATDSAAESDAYSFARSAMQSATESAAESAAVARRRSGYFKLKRACQPPPAGGPDARESPSRNTRLLVVRIASTARHPRLN